MSLPHQGRRLTSKQVALAEALAHAERRSEGDVAAYLDAMLHFSPRSHGDAFLIGKDIRRFAGLNAFLSEAIPFDPDELRVAIDRGVPQDDRVWRHFPLVADYFRAYSDDYADSPLRSIFFEVVSHGKYWRGPWSIFDKQAAVLEKNYHRAATTEFVDLIGDMRKLGLTTKIWNQMQQWTFPVNGNVVRANDYAAYLFNRCPMVSVAEWEMWYPQSAIVDDNDAANRKAALEYQQEQDRLSRLAGIKGNEADVETLGNTMPVLPIDVLARDLRIIFDNLGNKTSLSKFKIGHACSIEWSRVIGHSVRLMMFFDGSEVVDPAAHTDRLGDYCVEVTQGRMAYVNCSRQHDRYPEAGLIHADDEQARSALLRRLLLWAQKEQFLRVKASSGFKTFRTGDIPAAWRAASTKVSVSKVPDEGGATLDIPLRREQDGHMSCGVSHSEAMASRSDLA
ncbi:hypothetical protein [Paraburkholderia sp. UCT2]|uniref:hypothetical protein n=1 Tax=Paraburkholderia sp. UCT2 TaxID=2615208 RepID=UPI0016552D45|nr:hypothetical protein [Paraburkholderia sp. UCT2]MBC8726823.1 hypothetical protein [Paraburkholderia sp. UCT2]